MRRALAVMLSVLTFLPISGCTLSVYNNYRGLERLQVIETVGLDSAEDGGVTLSISAGRGASGREPVRASASAQSVTEAMQELQDRSRSDELFFSGTGCILLGEAAAAETARWLELIARSDSLRLDTPLFVVRGGEASELVTEAGGEESDITQIMNALMHYAEKSGPARIYTCLDAARSLIENGAALTGACIDCAKEAGFRQLELEVVGENETAVRLYKKYGFVEYGRNPRGFLTRDGRWQELVLMRLELEDAGARKGGAVWGGRSEGAEKRCGLNWKMRRCRK